MKTINILGTDYTFKVDDLNNPDLGTNDGYCKVFDKEICVRATEFMAGDSQVAKEKRTDHVVRQELVHAVAQEWGAPYVDNEDLVDWIAHIIPIINKAFNEIKELGE